MVLAGLLSSRENQFYNSKTTNMEVGEHEKFNWYSSRSERKGGEKCEARENQKVFSSTVQSNSQCGKHQRQIKIL